MSASGKRLWEALRLHRFAAHPEEGDPVRAEPILQGAHDLEAELIARVLADHDRDP